MKDKVLKIPAIALVSLFIGMSINSCQKEQPPTIEGRWKCIICTNENQSWEFKNGKAKQEYTFAGNQVFENEFHYWNDGPYLNMVNLKTEKITVWDIRFIGDAVAEIKDTTQQLQAIQYLERQ